MDTENTLLATDQTSNDSSANSESNGKADSNHSGQSSDEKGEASTLLGQDLAKDEAANAKAPENYEAWKLPEGISLNESLDADFKKLAKELGLSQESAQKLVDMQVKHSNAPIDKVMSEYKETTEGWKKDSIKEFGPDLNKEITYAKKAINNLGDPELLTFLNDTGLGNNKHFIKFFAKAGKLIAEDTMKDGQKRAPDKSLGELFYPSMTQK